MALIKVFSRSIISGVGSLLFQVIGYGGLVITARNIGPHDYGVVALASTIVGYFLIVTNFGLNIFGSREYPLTNDTESLLAGIMGGKLFLAICAILIAIPVLIFYSFDSGLVACILIYFSECVLSIIYIEWVFQGKCEFDVLLKAKVVYSTIFALILSAALYTGFLIYTLPIAHAASFLCSCVYLWKKCDLSFWPIIQLIKIEDSLRYVRASLGIFMSIILSFCMFSFATIVLSTTGDPIPVAQFGAGIKFILLVVGISGAYYTVIFPLASKLYIQNRYSLLELFQLSLKLSVLYGVVVSTLLVLYGVDLFSAIYGRNFDYDQTLLTILAGIFLLNSINTPFGKFLMSSSGEKILFMCLSISFIFNGVLAILTIPYYGVHGAAFSVLIGELVALPLQYYGLAQKIRFNLPRSITYYIFVALSAFSVLCAHLLGMSLVAGCAVAFFVFSVIFFSIYMSHRSTLKCLIS